MKEEPAVSIAGFFTTSKEIKKARTLEWFALSSSLRLLWI